VGFGGLAVFFAKMWARDRTRKRWRVLLGTHHVLAGLLFGVPGLILVLFHLTEHAITYYNLNGLVANPLTFFALPLGVGIMFGSQRALKWMRWCWVILAATSVIALAILPFVVQDTSIPTAMILPVNFLFAAALWRVRGADFDPKGSLETPA